MITGRCFLDTKAPLVAIAAFYKSQGVDFFIDAHVAGRFLLRVFDPGLHGFRWLLAAPCMSTEEWPGSMR